MSHEETRRPRGTAWHATSVVAKTLLSHLSCGAGDSQSIGLRLLEELPAAAEKPDRVNRGSSWGYDPKYARVAFRGDRTPGFRYRTLGLRLVEETGLEETEQKGTASGSNRVVRGGGWRNDPRGARVAFRFYNAPGVRYGNLGFRLVEVTNE